MRKSYEIIPPIIDISFAIGDDIKDCYSNLQRRGFTYVEGDIQIKGGQKFVALGYRRGIEKEPITDIIGVIESKEIEYETIYENAIEYRYITDDKKNCNIHKGSGGNFLGLYYTRDETKGSPIKELIFVSYPQKLTSKIEVVQNANTNKIQGNLNLNEGRRNERFNYIIIIR